MQFGNFSFTKNSELCISGILYFFKKNAELLFQQMTIHWI